MKNEDHLAQNFNYKQPTSSKVQADKAFQKTTMTESLKNIFMFIHKTKQESGWMVNRLEIKREPKKVVFVIPIGSTLTIDSKELVNLKSKQQSYDSFENNLVVVLDRMVAEELPWTPTKSQAIIQANELNYLLSAVRKEHTDEPAAHIEVQSLYDILKSITPNFEDYLPKFEVQFNTFAKKNVQI